MAGPSQLLVTLTGGQGVVTIAIPQALQTLDSSQPGAAPTGFSSVDQLVRSIFRAAVFYDGVSKWYPVSQIQSITSQ